MGPALASRAPDVAPDDCSRRHGSEGPTRSNSKMPKKYENRDRLTREIGGLSYYRKNVRAIRDELDELEGEADPAVWGRIENRIHALEMLAENLEETEENLYDIRDDIES